MNRSLKVDNKLTPIGMKSVIQKLLFFLFALSQSHEDRTHPSVSDCEMIDDIKYFCKSINKIYADVFTMFQLL